MGVKNKTKPLDYVVYDKDLGKDINKYAAGSYSGASKIGVDRKIPFQVFVPMQVPNPDAIQKDMLLKKKVRSVTDHVYKKLLNDLAQSFKAAGSKQVMGVLPPKVLDDLWQDMQKQAETAGNQIGLNARAAIKKYMDARSEGKVASFKLKYRRYTCALAVVGSTAGAVVATVTAVGATAATLGAASVAAGVAIAGATTATIAVYREYKRQTKTINETVDSIHNTIDYLRSSISAQVKKEVNVTSHEIAAKMMSSWFSTNIKSIKKLEQDTKKLKKQAQLEVLQASKDATNASDFHEAAKTLKKILDDVENDILDKSKGFALDLPQSIGELKKTAAKVKNNIKILKDTRDNIVDAAAKRRKAARQVIKVSVPRYEDIAAKFKEHRHDIGWTGVVINAVPAVVQTISYGISMEAVQSNVNLNNADAAADLAVALGENLQDLGNEIKDKVRKLR